MAEGGIGRYTELSPRNIRRSRMAEGGTGFYTEWSPRHINRSRYEHEDASKETSTIMNLLGYGPDLRQKRIHAYRENDRLWNARCNGAITGCFTAGSKAEGLTCAYESDIDEIYAQPNVVCLEDGIDENIVPDGITVFKMNTQIHNAGYCRVLLRRLARSGPPALLNALCCDEYGKFILSSALFVDFFKNTPRANGTVFHELAGPSRPWSNGPFRHDMVVAIRCHCPSILQRWAARRRHWPPPDIVQKVVSMAAFVTPVGFKGSEHKHVEWRICFNTGETELVNNLNDTQIKTYVMLKMIVNDVLNPRKKEVTSYTLKNIVLWLAENNPQSLFYSGSLFHWLHEGLDILRTAISTRQLPYFMIPERNLMAACGLDDEQQRTWVTTITDMINEGPRLILRLKKIRQAVISHPEPLLWYSKIRTELEMLHLEFTKRLLQCRNVNGDIDVSDMILSELTKRMNDISILVLQRMYIEGSSVNDMTQINAMMLG